MAAKRKTPRKESNLRRKVGIRPVKKSFLIVCEGVNTEAEGFGVAWSNQAFEFWFILHFILYHGPLHRSQYAEMLTKLTGMPYSKKAGVASALYNLLFPKLETAIRNAETVLEDFQSVPPAKSESATTVFRLARQLKS